MPNLLKTSYVNISNKDKRVIDMNALMEAKLEKMRQEELKKIKGIRVIPSQANYVMVEIDRDPKELTKVMLIKHNLLIKELSGKTEGKKYLRLAIRDTEDNNKLLAALRDEMR